LDADLQENAEHVPGNKFARENCFAYSCLLAPIFESI